MANYLGKPFTTGSSISHAKTEIMSLENGEWQSDQIIPFIQSKQFAELLVSYKC